MVQKGTSAQFLQDGRVYWALILLGLALYLPSISVSSVFMVLYIYILKIFLLPSYPLPISELSLVWLAVDLVCVTIILQCYDGVGWVS